MLKTWYAITLRLMIEIIIKILPIYHYDSSAYFPDSFSLLPIQFKKILHGFYTIEKVVKIRNPVKRYARQLMHMGIRFTLKFEENKIRGVGVHIKYGGKTRIDKTVKLLRHL